MFETAAIALITLAVVAFAAVSFQPRAYCDVWAVLAEHFATDERPRRFSTRSEHLLVRKRQLWFAWPRIPDEYAEFDVETDSNGLWLLYDGPEPKKCPDCLLIPWTRIRGFRRSGDTVRLTIDAGEGVEIAVPPRIAVSLLNELDRREREKQMRLG